MCRYYEQFDAPAPLTKTIWDVTTSLGSDVEDRCDKKHSPYISIRLPPEETRWMAARGHCSSSLAGKRRGLGLRAGRQAVQCSRDLTRTLRTVLRPTNPTQSRRHQLPTLRNRASAVGRSSPRTPLRPWLNLRAFDVTCGDIAHLQSPHPLTTLRDLLRVYSYHAIIRLGRRRRILVDLQFRFRRSCSVYRIFVCTRQCTCDYAASPIVHHRSPTSTRGVRGLLDRQPGVNNYIKTRYRVV